MSKPVDFLTVPLENGGSYTRLDRLTDGRVMCQLCFGYFATGDLNPTEGGVEDVCKSCAQGERLVASIGATVYASQGARRFHKTANCRSQRAGQELYGGWGTLRTHRLNEMAITTAFGSGKAPCAACFPGLRAALYRGNCEDDFGHEPMTVHTNGRLRAGECFRCLVPWPCTSAIVLGLVERDGRAAA